MEARKKNRKVIPNVELTEVQMWDDLAKFVRIGADLQVDVKQQLKKFLKESVNLYGWTTDKMSRIDPLTVFHKLAINKLTP